MWEQEETALAVFWWVWDEAGRDSAGLLLSPSHAWQSKPALKAPRSAEVLPGGSARAALLLLCLNAGPFVDSEAPTP